MKRLCECTDSGCPVHEGKEDCGRRGNGTVYRVDMEDNTGTVMCAACADDAMQSGVFRYGK